MSPPLNNVKSIPKQSKPADFCRKILRSDMLGARILFYLVVVAGFLGPVLFTPQIGGITLFPYRLLILALCLVFFLQISIRGGALTLPGKTTRLYLLFYLGWLVYACLSLAWTPEKAEGIRNILLLSLPVTMIGLTVFYVQNMKHIKAIIHIWFIVLIFFLALGLVEVTTGYHLPSSAFFMEERVRFRFLPTAVFYNNNDFATFIVLSLPFLISFIQYRNSLVLRLAGLGICILYLDILFYTGSRANFLAVLLQVGVLGVLMLRKKKIAALMAFLLTAAILLIVVPFPVNMIQGNPMAMSSYGGVLDNTAQDINTAAGSLSTRLSLYKNAMHLFLNSGAFGVGAGGAEYMMKNFAVYDTGGVYKIHNWWLELLVNYGVLVLCGYVLLYLSLIFSLYKIYLRPATNDEQGIAQALLLALTGFFVGSISSSSLFTFYPQWLLFGLSIVFLKTVNKHGLDDMSGGLTCPTRK